MNDTIIATLIQEIGPILISLILAWLAWLMGKYLRSLGDEKKLAKIIHVANAAIDYAEDLDKRGDLKKILSGLDLPQEIVQHTSTGIKKLHVAGQWVKDELKRLGIDMTEEEARTWVAAEFQKRIASLDLTPDQMMQMQELLKLLQRLDQDKLRALLAGNGHPEMPGEKSTSPNDLPPVDLKSLAELPTPETESQETASALSPALELSPDHDLATLAQQAVQYVETLKIDRQLTLPEIDIATAWMLTEVTKRDLNVTPDQIAREIHRAFGG
jgi:hypothetical protein